MTQRLVPARSPRQVLVGTCLFIGLAALAAAAPPGLDTWTGRDSGSETVYFAAAYGNDAFAISGQGAALTSSDGSAWTSASVPPTWDNYVDLWSDASGFMMCGYLDGTVATSSDGAAYTELSRRLQNDHFNAIARNGDTVVAGGYDHVNGRGEIYHSTDGGLSFSETAPGFGTAADVAVVDGVFYVLTWLFSGTYYTNTVYASATGTGWDDTFVFQGGQARSLAHGNGTFVVVGTEGAVVTSPNGIAWTGQSAGTTESLMGVAFGNGVFVAVGANGTVISSPDGVTWTPHASGTSFLLRGVAFGADSFVAVGDNSPTSSLYVVIQSDPIPMFAGDFESGSASGWSNVVY